jgi:uncharacterized membrane protein
MQQGNRLEAFTDAAFAFALTLLAISGDQMPGSVAELKLALQQVPAFLGSAALLLMFWHEHGRWSREFRTDDGAAVVLTAILVCTVLVYVYPLKMMLSGCFYWLSGGWLSASFDATGPHDIFDLMAIYGYGFITMCVSMLLLYRHSLRRAEALGLDAEQRLRAHLNSLMFLLMALPGVLSIVLAYTLPEPLLFLVGCSYALLGVIMPVYGLYADRCMRALRAGEAAPNL